MKGELFKVTECGEVGKGGPEIDPMARKVISKSAKTNSLRPSRDEVRGLTLAWYQVSKGSSASGFMRGGQLGLSWPGQSAVRVPPAGRVQLQCHFGGVHRGTPGLQNL